MQQRVNYTKAAPGLYEAMDALDQYVRGCGLERTLVFLVQLRSSQLNGCAYCIDMHWKDLRAAGENEQRLYSLEAWRECLSFSERERAAFEWTEAVTLVTIDMSLMRRTNGTLFFSREWPQSVSLRKHVRREGNRMYGLIGKRSAALGHRDELIGTLLAGTTRSPAASATSWRATARTPMGSGSPRCGTARRVMPRR